MSTYSYILTNQCIQDFAIDGIGVDDGNMRSPIAPVIMSAEQSALHTSCGQHDITAMTQKQWAYQIDEDDIFNYSGCTYELSGASMQTRMQIYVRLCEHLFQHEDTLYFFSDPNCQMGSQPYPLIQQCLSWSAVRTMWENALHHAEDDEEEFGALEQVQPAELSLTRIIRDSLWDQGGDR